MTRRRLAFIAIMLLAMSARADAAPEGAPTGSLDAFVDAPAGAPYVGEPLRLVLRAAVHGRIANDRLEQPALVDFDWQQFGVDSSREELIDGFWTPVVERVLMIYPLRAGRLTIPPFKRRVYYLIGDNERGEIEFASQPIALDVRARDGVGDPDEFWLPATALSIVDEWEPEPDKIPFGETARRVVTVEAEGVTAERLPPLPNFRAPGIITFAGPVERRTIVTDRGPIGRVVYRWNIRPVSMIPALAPAIRVPWFDVSARRPREAAAPERRIAFIGATQAKGASESIGLLSPRPLIAALLGFVSTAAAAFYVASSPRARGGSRARGDSWRRFAQTQFALLALRIAARKGDVAAFRRALDAVAKTDAERWRRVTAQSDIASALAALDAALFAREPPPGSLPPPRLAGNLAGKIAAALRRDAALTAEQRVRDARSSTPQ
jgi:hypothetical protein